MHIDAADLKRFGARVKAARNDIGISQEVLAARTGLHRTYISGIERGRRNPSLLNILRIARALNLPPSTLLEE